MLTKGLSHLLPTAAAGSAVLSHQVISHLDVLWISPSGWELCSGLRVGLPFPCVYSKGCKDEGARSPCNTDSGERMLSRQCRKGCSSSGDLFTTHGAVIVSWWSWEHSSIAPKIEYTAPAQIHVPGEQVVCCALPCRQVCSEFLL